MCLSSNFLCQFLLKDNDGLVFAVCIFYGGICTDVKLTFGLVFMGLYEALRDMI